jgi:hypothetical protein
MRRKINYDDFDDHIKISVCDGEYCVQMMLSTMSGFSVAATIIQTLEAINKLNHELDMLKAKRLLGITEGEG